MIPENPNQSVPGILVISLEGIKELIENGFPLIDADRDELVRQVFEFYVNSDDMSLEEAAKRYRPNLSLLHIDHYLLSDSKSAQHRLSAVAMEIHSLIFAQLIKHNFAEVSRVQDGFYYIFERFLPNGYFVVLRNIALP